MFSGEVSFVLVFFKGFCRVVISAMMFRYGFDRSLQKDDGLEPVLRRVVYCGKDFFRAL